MTMTLLAISSLTPNNKPNELNIEDQKLVKGGFFNNTTELYRETTVNTGSAGSITVTTAPGSQYINNNVNIPGNGTFNNNIYNDAVSLVPVPTPTP